MGRLGEVDADHNRAQHYELFDYHKYHTYFNLGPHLRKLGKCSKTISLCYSLRGDGEASDHQSGEWCRKEKTRKWRAASNGDRSGRVADEHRQLATPL